MEIALIEFLGQDIFVAITPALILGSMETAAAVASLVMLVMFAKVKGWVHTAVSICLGVACMIPNV
jgi:hypothetical protein